MLAKPRQDLGREFLEGGSEIFCCTWNHTASATAHSAYTQDAQGQGAGLATPEAGPRKARARRNSRRGGAGQ